MTSGAAEGDRRAPGERLLAEPAQVPAREERVIAAPSLWRELFGGLIVFGIYSVVAGLDWHGRAAAANAHGRDLFALERALRLDLELPLNHLLVPHELLRTAANYEYAVTYVASALALLAWLYLHRPATYRWARTSFVLLNVLALGCFAVYPVTPPRLLPELGFVDTVRLGHTWGSWGSPMVEHANQLAAMPSLHIAWAVWVSVVLACVSGARWLQVASGVHVLVTALVIMATANHYLLDAVGGVLLVWLTLALMGVFQDRPGRTGSVRVPASDGFFLHVESAKAAQHVGGLVMIDEDGAGYRERLRSLIEAHLEQLPRFRQRLSAPSRWRRPRWVPHEDLDWGYHVPEFDVTGPDGRPGGLAGLHALIAEHQSAPLPRDRPLWRFMVVRGVAADRAAAVLLVHHVVSDGIGTVAQVMRMLEPPMTELPVNSSGRPGAVRSALAIALGVAQLATDGGARYRLPTGDSPERRFGTVDLPLDQVREVARRHGTRVSDVLLSAVAGALRRVGSQRSGDDSPKLRVAVPLMVREPGSSAEGNLTAAVMMDLPLGPLAEPERLAEVASHSRRLRTGTRALASRFVMRTVGQLLPPPVHAWFARTVYGARFFQAIVSNMPGANRPMGMAGAHMAAVYPILPLAPGAPLAIGALGWDGVLYVGISADPALVPDADVLGEAIGAVVGELGRAAPARSASRIVKRPAELA
jgi:diacylglycerol O-acyltransferase / wax synthase